jgi:hypothetical protein
VSYIPANAHQRAALRLSYARQNVKRILDFEEDLVFLFAKDVFFGVFTNIPEHILIVVAQVKHGIVIRRYHVRLVDMGCRPFLEIKHVVENFALEQLAHANSFLNNIDEVMLKQLRVNVGVLMLYDVFQD